MSCTVLVIPEDPTYNGYLLEPLVQRLLAECGKPNAKTKVLTDPRLRGFEHASSMIEAIAERYAHFDLMLFMVDADGNDRGPSFERLEQLAAGKGARLVCCAARQEVEIWLLAGHVTRIGVPWSQAREEIDLKERIFLPFLGVHGDARRAGGGRDVLMRETLSNYEGLLQRCPELRELQDRIGQVLQDR